MNPIAHFTTHPIKTASLPKPFQILFITQLVTLSNTIQALQEPKTASGALAWKTG